MRLPVWLLFFAAVGDVVPEGLFRYWMVHD